MGFVTFKRSVALALMGTVLAGPTFAQNYFLCGAPIEEDQTLELGLIQSDGPGMDEVYDYRLSELGQLWGSVVVHEGAAPDLVLISA